MSEILVLHGVLLAIVVGTLLRLLGLLIGELTRANQ